jgi:hypothetical protein
MPTKVYITGTRITVSKTGGQTLVIPQYRCKRTYVGSRQSQEVGTDIFTQVSISDIVLDVSITDDIDKIQDQNGAFIGDYSQVEAYLSGFINRGDSYLTTEEGCTKANQEIMIAQNEEIKADLNQLNITQEDTQDVIKKELQENNKILKKIYE